MKRITKKFRAYLKLRKIHESAIAAPLVGINELRNVVAWANAQPEYTHDWMTPAEIIDRYRKEGW